MRLIAILTLVPAVSLAFEPISTTYLAGAAVASIAGYFYYKSDTCEKMECCQDPWVRQYPYLGFNDLHGQPLVVKLVKDVINRRRSYSRPLLLSFHGPVGTGKTFLSTLLSSSIFKRGKESAYVHFFSVGYHFPNPSKVWDYHDELISQITATLMMCPKSIFIFDEFEKIPSGLTKTIAAFLEPRGKVGLVNTGEAIFILLSNTGSKAIVKKSFELYKNGIDRKDFKISDFEGDLRLAVFNEEGAYKGSELIKKELIDAYVPFLPLEKEHVRSCIISEYRRFHGASPSDEAIQDILKEINFSHEMNDLYAETGCKKVLALVARY